MSGNYTTIEEEMTEGIKFTQYLRPDGRKRIVSFPTGEELRRKADELIESGLSFDVEELTTGIVSMTCTRGDEDCIAHELCSNGPDVAPAVRTLVKTAYEKEFGHD